MKHKFKEGDKVVVREWSGKTVTATIESACDEKNCRPVYDLDNDHWCYEDQIVKIIKIIKIIK